MRIIHILNHTFRLNGNVHAAIDLACAQAELGHVVAVCSRGGSFDEVLQRNNVEVLKLEAAGNLFSPRCFVRLAVFLWRWRPDVIHAHMMGSAVVAWLLTRIFDVPLVTTVHNAFQRSAILMGLGDRVINVSRAVQRTMAARGIATAKLRTVLNGTLGAARLAGPMPLPAQLSHPCVLFVGGLHPRKGVEDLIKAFEISRRCLPGLNLYLVGEGPCQKDYEKLVAALGCSASVHFCGAHDDPRPYLRAADVFVLASHSDPAPLVLSEAREAGCAIIATDVDGVPELLEGGAAGILVPPAQPEQIAIRLLRLLEDPAALDSCRSSSQINLEGLSIRRVALETIAIYDDCLNARRS